MAQTVKSRGQAEGMVAVFYRGNVLLGEDDTKLLGIIVSAVGIEEERIKAHQELQQAYDKLKNTQRSLVQSEKFAALGRFSSGIAHEVKNPLGIILGGIEFLEQKLKSKDEEILFATKKIKESTLRADSILRNLLKFARPSELKVEKIKLQELLEDVLSFFKYLCGSSHQTTVFT